MCGVLLLNTLWEDLASSAALPRGLIEPMGVIELLYELPISFARFASSETALQAFQ